jgi:uncharacterized protein YegP (UPF0339 family)
MVKQLGFSRDDSLALDLLIELRCKCAAGGLSMSYWKRGLAVVAMVGAVGIAALAPTSAQDKPKKGEKAKSTLTFEVYKDASEGFRWRLRAGNNQIIATSGAGYKNKADCMHGIDVIKTGAAKAQVKDSSDAQKID